MFAQFFFRMAAALAALSLVAFATSAAAQSVLIVGAPANSAWINDVRAKVQGAGAFTTVDTFNANAGTPSVATLQAYDAVLVFSDTGFNNAILLGDNLHTYLLGGGGVVNAVFALGGGADIRGQFESSGDTAQLVACCGGGAATLGTVALPAHPIMTGVATFNGGSSGYRGSGALNAGATEVARWSSGELLVSYKPVATGMVVSLNMYPPSSDARGDFWTASTDGARLMANALTFAASAGTPPDTIPTMTEWARILFGLLLAGGAAVMVQRRRLAA